MNALAFDTHRIVKRLREAGFSDVQAETVTDVLGESRQLDLSNLATKADVAEVKADVAAMRSEVKASISEARTDLLKWVIGAVGLQTVVIVGTLIAMTRPVLP